MILDPVSVPSFSRIPYEVEWGLEIIRHFLDHKNWHHDSIKLEFVKVKNVLHLGDDNTKHGVCYVSGMTYILLPLDKWSVMALVILFHLYPVLLKEYAFMFIRDLKCGMNELIDATDKANEKYHLPPLGFRRNLKQAVTRATMSDIHNVYKPTFFGASANTMGHLRNFGTLLEYDFKPFIEASEKHGCTWIMMRKLPTACGIVVPTEFNNHYGANIGGLQRAIYDGDDFEAVEEVYRSYVFGHSTLDQVIHEERNREEDSASDEDGEQKQQHDFREVDSEEDNTSDKNEEEEQQDSSRENVKSTSNNESESEANDEADSENDEADSDYMLDAQVRSDDNSVLDHSDNESSEDNFSDEQSANLSDDNSVLDHSDNESSEQSSNSVNLIGVQIGHHSSGGEDEKSDSSSDSSDSDDSCRIRQVDYPIPARGEGHQDPDFEIYEDLRFLRN